MASMAIRAGITVDERSLVLAVNEVAEAGDFRIVVADEAGSEPTQASAVADREVRSFVAPVRALDVTFPAAHRPAATAGVIRADDGGGLLAITAAHAVRATAGEILVGGAVAQVIGCHDLTDTCLLTITCPASHGAGRAGVLRFPPVEHHHATFDGAASGHKRTWVRDFDLSVLDPSPYLSSKIYTDPDTIPGDSGAGLIDSEDRMAEFAVSRTPLGAPLEFSTWSWAEQVLAAHGLDS
jgi:hypothetical protein